MRPGFGRLAAGRGVRVSLKPIVNVAAFALKAAHDDAGVFASRGRAMHHLAEGVALCDALVVCAAALAAYFLRYGAEAPPMENTATTLLAVALTYKMMRMLGAYAADASRDVMVWIGKAAQAWTCVFVILICLVYLTKTADAYSRIWVVGWYVAALLGFAAIRFAFHLKIREWRRLGRLARTVAIVDLTGSGARLARRIQDAGSDEIRLLGLFARESGAGRSGMEELMLLSRLFRIDEVMVTVSGDTGAAADAVLRSLRRIPTNVRLCPDLPDLAIPPSGAGFWLGSALLTVQRRPINGWNGVAKRLEDVAIASVLLLLLLPFMAAIAIAIKLDSPGPVLFRQERHGFNNNVFLIWKFRSMASAPQGDGAVRQASRDDPRVTRVGRLLRRTSLDELPQLFNILRGEMSLVGPRPHALPHNEQYAALIDDYLGRHRVLPGLTGLAQVNGFRGETDTLDKMQRRIECDLAYIDNWSLFLDLKILLKTAIVAGFQRNAY